MMKIKIKAKGRKFFIPVPYSLLHLSLAILTSKKVRDMANQAIEKKSKKAFQIPKIGKADLQPLLTGLTEHKGLLLVETTLKDGTEVSVRL